MKKAFLFLALCLLGAGRAAAAEPVDSVRNVIYMIGDGMGLAHVSMLAVEGGYAPTAFDRAQGIALISTYSANNRVTDSAAARRLTDVGAGSPGRASAVGHRVGRGRRDACGDCREMPSPACHPCGVLCACPGSWRRKGHYARPAGEQYRRAHRCWQAARKGVLRGRFVSRCVRPPRLCGRRFARDGCCVP